MTESSSNEQQGNHGMIQNVATLLLAGLGAALLVEEGVERFMGRLIGDDDAAEQSLSNSSSINTSAANQRQTGVTGFTQRQIASVLRLLNLPSHSEIASLSSQVDALNRKVDQLNSTDR